MAFQIDVTHFIFAGLLSGLFYETWLILQTPVQRIINITAEKKGFFQYNICLVLYVTGVLLCFTNWMSAILVPMILASLIERSYIRMKRIIHQEYPITDWWFNYWIFEKAHSGLRFLFLLTLFYLNLILV